MLEIETYRSAYYNSDDPTWVYSDAIGVQDIIITARRDQTLPSARSLNRVLQAAEMHGVSYTPSDAGFAEIVATTAAFRKRTAAARDAETWILEAFGASPSAYMKFVHAQMRHIAPVLEEQILKKIQTASYPENFVFEFANVCNLACPVCPRHHRAIGDGLMSLGAAQRILDDIADTNKEITFYPHFLGETLIHPDFLKLVDHATKYKHVKVNIISNGILLDAQMTEELLSRPLTQFHFSLHECDTAEHDGVHPKHAVSAENTLNFLKRAVELGKRDEIWVGVSMIPARLDETAVQTFQAFWQPIVEAVNIWPAMDKNRRSLDSDVNDAFDGFYLPCLSPWNQPVISVEGSVLPCCWDYEHTMVLGNVFEQSFDDIFNGDKATELKRATRSKDLANFPTCADCQKWMDYIPPFRQITMGDFLFQSNGTMGSFATAQRRDDVLEQRISEIEIEGSGRQHFPLHKGGRMQAQKTYTAMSS